MHRRIPLAVALLLALALAPPVAAEGNPDFPPTTDERFDAAALGAYEGDHPAIYAHIDDNLDAHVGNLQRWLRQPSITTSWQICQLMPSPL